MKLISITNQLAGIYTVWIFTERYFGIDYIFNFNYKFMQWWGVGIRGHDRIGKIISI